MVKNTKPSKQAKTSKNGQKQLKMMTSIILTFNIKIVIKTIKTVHIKTFKTSIILRSKNELKTSLKGIKK